MADNVCCIHYDSIETTNKLVEASEISSKTLQECKLLRESDGGENHHEEQCKGVPETFLEKSCYYHRECYQKFTFVKTSLKRKLGHSDSDATGMFSAPF